MIWMKMATTYNMTITSTTWKKAQHIWDPSAYRFLLNKGNKKCIICLRILTNPWLIPQVVFINVNVGVPDAKPSLNMVYTFFCTIQYQQEKVLIVSTVYLKKCGCNQGMQISCLEPLKLQFRQQVKKPCRCRILQV